MDGLMKTLMLEATDSAQIREIPIPTYGKGEILIRTKAGTVCTSDLLDMKHNLFNLSLPVVMGHEGAGVVVAVGEDVADIKVGDEVAVHPVMPCLKCPTCLRGLKHLCDDMEHLAFNRPGVFAEYFVTRPDCVRVKPVGMSFPLASLMEPVCVCLEAIERAAVRPGGRVLIIGDGPFGVMISKLCKHKKPKQIILTGRHDFRLQQAADGTGAIPVGTINEKKTPDMYKAIMDITEGEGVDSVVLCVSNPAAMDLAIEILRPRGTVAVFAALSGKTPVDLFRVHMKELTIAGSNNDEDYMDLAIQLLSDPELNLQSIITHEIPFEQWQEAFYQAEQGKSTCLKASMLM